MVRAGWIGQLRDELHTHISHNYGYVHMYHTQSCDTYVVSVVEGWDGVVLCVCVCVCVSVYICV